MNSLDGRPKDIYCNLLSWDKRVWAWYIRSLGSTSEAEVSLVQVWIKGREIVSWQSKGVDLQT